MFFTHFLKDIKINFNFFNFLNCILCSIFIIKIENNVKCVIYIILEHVITTNSYILKILSNSLKNKYFHGYILLLEHLYISIKTTFLYLIRSRRRCRTIFVNCFYSSPEVELPQLRIGAHIATIPYRPNNVNFHEVYEMQNVSKIYTANLYIEDIL